MGGAGVQGMTISEPLATMGARHSSGMQPMPRPDMVRPIIATRLFTMITSVGCTPSDFIQLLCAVPAPDLLPCSNSRRDASSCSLKLRSASVSYTHLTLPTSDLV